MSTPAQNAPARGNGNSVAATANAAVKPPHYGLLSSVTVPTNIEIKPKGLVLIVGPNSAGKTQLLKDIQAVLIGQPRDLVVCSDYKLSKPPSVNHLLQHLCEEGYFRKERDTNGNEYIKQNTPHLGGGSFRGDKVLSAHVPQFFSTMPASNGGLRRIESVPFLSLVGHCLTTALFLENRLTLANQVQQFDYATSPPNNDIQALYLSKEAKLRLTGETERVFGKGIWVDSTRGGIYCLRVNQRPCVPSPDDRQEPEEMMKYRQIESEGDGMRSYVGICIALLLGRRPMCIIDEPELCLHPPQAYAMGRFIGQYGTSNDNATLVSTHSSHVLRGIIEVTDDVQILRLTKSGGEFRGHMIGYDALKECMKRPIVRAETILDGIFADAVAIVESEGDRAVYQAAWEGARAYKGGDSSAADQLRRDVLFIPVGGTGGIADIASFYRTLRIPVAIIADLDLIMDRDKLERILDVSCDAGEKTGLITRSREVAEEIKKLPPSISEADVKQVLNGLASEDMDWNREDDAHLKSELIRLAHKIDRMRRLKSGGVECFCKHPKIYEGLNYIIGRCKTFGLMLVPVGELEYWSPGLMSEGPSKQRKAEWANEAATRIRQAPQQAVDLFDFMQDMAQYHASDALRLANR